MYTINWQLFCIFFGIMLLISFLMALQGRHFYTKDVVIRKFSIMDLEIPATPLELKNVLAGLYDLPPEQSRKSIGALKGQLYLDFLYMPFAYGCIYIACALISGKMEHDAGKAVFTALAFLQFLPWLFDIIENIYLLSKIKPDVKASSNPVHKAYLAMEAAKWGIALTGAICAIAALCYFWLSGSYASDSVRYFVFIVAEIIIFAALLKFFIKTPPPQKA
ncbi:hypothetical protein QTN47_12120 [Danxiaibacter flavus]|uniref:Uncharacterized protein n=1 Tax=Danxiaibacter flavus TaxID=3049108 RepID=A0ABV3ZIK1_9BACT|nr:hypothetical protein QNM32_12125 [Chitinophagaceae bacterium DXS]